MKCDKCNNKSWKECCNNCKENMLIMKDYLEHLGYHYSDPDQHLVCSM